MTDGSLSTGKYGGRDRRDAIIVLFWVFCVVALAITILRMHSRRMIRAVGADDWTMAFTTLLLFAFVSMTTVLAVNGGTKHTADIPPDRLQFVLKLNWATQPFAILALATSKISVALLLLRILGPSAFWRRWFLISSMVLVFIFNSLAAIFSFVQCSPPRALWEKVPDAKCWDPRSQSAFSVFSASWNMFMDVSLALLPITIIWGLSLNVGKKVALSTLLGLGIFVAISAGIKTSTLASLNARSDLTWATFKLYAWSGVEIFLLIVCGSIPTLKPLYDRILGHKKVTNASYLSNEIPLSQRNHPYEMHRESSPQPGWSGQPIRPTVISTAQKSSRRETLTWPETDTSRILVSSRLETRID